MLKNDVEKLAIWQYFLTSDKHRAYPFIIFMLCSSQRKNCIITGLISDFFNAPCKRVTSSLQKRKHHKALQLQCFLFGYHIYMETKSVKKRIIIRMKYKKWG